MAGAQTAPTTITTTTTWWRRLLGLPPPPPPAAVEEAITAAVSPVRLDGAAWQTWRFGSTLWQTEAWRLYDITGQLRFIANWVGNCVSRCRLYVAEVDPAGEAGQETDDPDVAALAAGPLGQGPAKDEALRLIGINLYVPGEAYIIAEAESGPNGEDQWFVVSGRQIRRHGNDIVIRRSQLHGGGDMTFRPDVDLILRVWTPHPADTDEADSPARSAIPDLRELEAIRKREFAELDSRLTGAGMLPLPEGVQLPTAPGGSGVDGFMQLLQQTMALSLTDRASAQAMVPIAFTVPGEYLDKIHQVTFWSELSAQLLPLRQAAIISLAQSLDAPPEVLLGVGNSNHWSAWQVSEDAVRTQIHPILSRIADALTTGYLKAALKIKGRDPEAYVYAFDVSPLTNRTDRSADALNYYQAGLLSDEATVEAGAFRKDQMPDAAERLRHLAEKLVLADPTLLDDKVYQQLLGVRLPGPPAPPAGQPAEPGRPPSPAPAPPSPAPAPAPAPQPVPNPTGPPQPTPPPDNNPTGPPGQRQPASADQAVWAVANLAMLRALSLAGSRLVPHTQRDRWPGLGRHELHTRVGPVSTDRAEEVLRSGWDYLADVAAELAVSPHDLHACLHGHAVDLLTRGVAYDPRVLPDLVAPALQRRAVRVP